MLDDAVPRPKLAPIAPKDPHARAIYLAELKRLYTEGRLQVCFAHRPLPDCLLASVMPDAVN